MKTTCKLSVTMLAFILGAMLLPVTAISSTTSAGSQNHLTIVPSSGVTPASKADVDGGGSSHNPNIVPLQSKVGGKSYAEWNAAWWQWTMSHPVTQFFDPTGQYFAVDQSGPAWFLQGAIDTPERSCTMPSGTFLVCPILLYLNDYPCPDPTWQPPAGQSMEEWLTEGARAVMDYLVPTSPFPLSLEIDGQAVNNLVGYRTTSRMFTFTGDLSMQAFDPCVTGSPQPGVSDGYMVILKPLPPGEHTLHFSGFGDIVVHLTVANSGPLVDGPSGAAASASGDRRGGVAASSKSWSLVKSLYR